MFDAHAYEALLARVARANRGELQSQELLRVPFPNGTQTIGFLIDSDEPGEPRTLVIPREPGGMASLVEAGWILDFTDAALLHLWALLHSNRVILSQQAREGELVDGVAKVPINESLEVLQFCLFVAAQAAVGNRPELGTDTDPDPLDCDGLDPRSVACALEADGYELRIDDCPVLRETDLASASNLRLVRALVLLNSLEEYQERDPDAEGWTLAHLADFREEVWREAMRRE